MRIVFIATGDIALPAFRHLLVNGPVPIALVTQPDKPVGRKQVLSPPRIKTEALQAGVAVLQPDSIGEIVEELRRLKPDLLLVMAYGQIFRNDILSLAGATIVNLHASLLPKYRGAACIQAAIEEGDAVTGISAQHMVRKLDAGDIIVSSSIPIAADETGGSLHDRLAELAVSVMQQTIGLLRSGSAPRIAQDEAQATYIGKLLREDGRLDWSMPAERLERRIRAYDPWPGTYATALEAGKQKRLKVFPPTRVLDQALQAGEVCIQQGRMWVGTGAGSLELTTVQPDGGKRMQVSEYLLGHKPERLI